MDGFEESGDENPAPEAVQGRHRDAPGHAEGIAGVEHRELHQPDVLELAAHAEADDEGREEQGEPVEHAHGVHGVHGLRDDGLAVDVAGRHADASVAPAPRRLLTDSRQL